MGRSATRKKSVKPSKPAYILDEQIGFILRQVWQRHAAIFARDIGILSGRPSYEQVVATQYAGLWKQ